MFEFIQKKIPLFVLVLVVCSTLYFGAKYLSQQHEARQISNLNVPFIPEEEKIPVTPFISAHGTKLYLNGEQFQFTGVNAYHLGTYPGVNAGCGGYREDLDSFFQQLRPNSVVRMWAFQGGMGTNVNTKELDWSGLDRVVAAAERNQIKLLFVLGDQSGTCDDGHWKDQSWYETGYTEAVNDLNNGLTPLPYLEYVRLIVDRYKDSEVIAMWEPINEPESSNCVGAKGTACYTRQTCVDEASATKALRSFFDVVGGEIKKIDNNHIVSSGVIGDGQCGAIFEDYQYIHESPGIDVASFHDYHRGEQAMPGDEWNGLQKRLDQMEKIQKPLIVGEVGIQALDNSKDCMGYAERRDKYKAKMDAQFKAGIAGFMPWAFTMGVSKICNYDIVVDDPVLELLREFPVSMGSVTPQPSVSPTAEPDLPQP